MKQIKIIKGYKKLAIGDTPIVEDAYAAILIKKGIAEDSEKPKADKK